MWDMMAGHMLSSDMKPQMDSGKLLFSPGILLGSEVVLDYVQVCAHQHSQDSTQGLEVRPSTRQIGTAPYQENKKTSCKGRSSYRN